MIKTGENGLCSAPDCPHKGTLRPIMNPTRMLCGTCVVREFRKMKKMVEAKRMYDLSLDPTKLTANQYDNVLGALVANINSFNKTLKLEYLPRIIRVAVVDMLGQVRGLEKNLPVYEAPAQVIKQRESEEEKSEADYDDEIKADPERQADIEADFAAQGPPVSRTIVVVPSPKPHHFSDEARRKMSEKAKAREAKKREGKQP